LGGSEEIYFYGLSTIAVLRFIGRFTTRSYMEIREKFGKARQAQRRLAEVIRQNPNASWMDIAISENVCVSTVSSVAKKFGLSRGVKRDTTTATN
jgi:hypothetical protein